MSVDLDQKVQIVLERIVQRSAKTRADYISRMEAAQEKGVSRKRLSCGNLAHGMAACSAQDKTSLGGESKNIAIVSAYNDMLSAHQPFAVYPDQIKEALSSVGAVAQVAGGVPAMCDGVTQGQPGMELSLFSRDTIAMSTAVALSHNMFDGVALLGVCDKIVPGMLIGALSFGHLPVAFLPAGPMESGLPNREKAKIREQFAKGEIGREELLASELKSYHSAGTCTFYGTANSNQMLMEFMGLHLPGTSFVNPSNPLRPVLTFEAAKRLVLGGDEKVAPLYRIISEKAIVNGIVGLLASGGSTNLCIHLVAIARAAGIIINWDDFAELSESIPLLARVYPNGSADVNQFHAAGGLAVLISELLSEGLLIEDVDTLVGYGLSRYCSEPKLKSGNTVCWEPVKGPSLDSEIIRSVANPFKSHGGTRLMSGNLGRGIVKTSAVAEDKLEIEAPAMVFESQEAMEKAFKAGLLHKDCVVVVRNQGPKANGMPELHKLSPSLGVLQTLGYQIALVTDGRMSGASGKVPAAIHLYPEAADGGPISKIQDGDIISFNGRTGNLNIMMPVDILETRSSHIESSQVFGFGRELFHHMRERVTDAESGASVLFEGSVL